ncbi:MAG: GAF domain-containing protein [Acidobacteria bacterium]|nr:GAF domain-containing protein [Acidobacteriota bacterium]
MSESAALNSRVSPSWSRKRIVWSALASAAMATLITLGVGNILAIASWNEADDGVLWKSRADGVTAAEIASGTAASRAGVRPGDVLLQIDERSIDTPDDVVAALHASRPGARLRYTILRLGSQEVVELPLARVPYPNRGLYYVLAVVGIFTLLVGGMVRLRRPADQATLHFFWLCAAFFGTFTFSHSGRFDRIDWFYYWADAIATLLLPPLFLHFTLAFPERPRIWARRAHDRRRPKSAPRFELALLYLAAGLLGFTRVFAVAKRDLDPRTFIDLIEVVDRVELLYLALCLVGGFAVLIFALQRTRSVTARRQLRWIVWGTGLGGAPFALGYAIPYAVGMTPTLPMELSAIPLSIVPMAFACAIVRYRLMDVEVIVKRGLVYAAAVAAIVAIYLGSQQLAGLLFLQGSDRHNSVIALLATLVVVLLARPVKNSIQNMLDRVFYRDRYDYRRALVGFARDLNADLDLDRLSQRLVARITETLVVDRMALMLVHDRSGDLRTFRAVGFAQFPPPLPAASSVSARLQAGQIVALDDPIASRHVQVEEVERWRDRGVYYFVPCVSKEGAIAALALGRKDANEPLNSEDLALLTAVAGQVATALENGRLYTQLRQKADEVERMREFNENILESLDDGLAVVDVDDRVVRWNVALSKMRGLLPADAVGRRLPELFDAGFVRAIEAARRDSPRGAALYRVPMAVDLPPGGGSHEHSGGSGKDAVRLVNLTIVPLRATEAAGECRAGTVIILDDVTDRVKLEEQLQISEKMASIGLLAAGVAHEVNTPLTGISSYTQMLLQETDAQDPKSELLQKIERQTFRAAKIVNSLLNLSRQGPATGGERTPVDLNVVINDVLSLLEHQLRNSNLQVRRELAETGPVVLGIEYKLQQVFLNLVLNARDAMPKGGWLSVSTRVENGHAIAVVADTGSGIPNEHLTRIYDPFFTTKGIGEGTGLGLSVVYGIVREHQGALSCESAVGEGTRFTLTLPLAPFDSAHPSTALGVTLSPPKGQGRPAGSQPALSGTSARTRSSS